MSVDSDPDMSRAPMHFDVLPGQEGYIPYNDAELEARQFEQYRDTLRRLNPDEDSEYIDDVAVELVNMVNGLTFAVDQGVMTNVKFEASVFGLAFELTIDGEEEL